MHRVSVNKEIELGSVPVIIRQGIFRSQIGIFLPDTLEKLVLNVCFFVILLLY